ERAILRVGFDLAPQTSVSVGLVLGELAYPYVLGQARTLRPGLAREPGLQRVVGVVERQVRLDEVHGQPLADALRGRFVAGVADGAGAKLETREEEIRRDADEQAAGEFRIRREVFRGLEGRGALEGELDRPAAVEPFPHRQLHVEEEPG